MAREIRASSPPDEPETRRDDAVLSIGDLARLTGLSTGVLRVWERRYRALAPVRLPSGHRRYRQTDVERMMAIAGALAEGARIGEVARLPLVALRDRHQGAAAEVQELVAEALDALQSFDSQRFTEVSRRARERMDLARLGDLFVSPLMRRIGDRWRDGVLSIGQEHVASSILAGLLRPQPSSPPDPEAPQALIATLEGEPHALVLLLLEAVLRSAGWRVLSGGPNLPIADTARLAERIATDAVIVSATWMGSSQNPRQILPELRALLPGHVSLLVGGQAAGIAAAELDSSQVTIFEDLRSLEDWLRSPRRP